MGKTLDSTWLDDSLASFRTWEQGYR